IHTADAPPGRPKPRHCDGRGGEPGPGAATAASLMTAPRRLADLTGAEVVGLLDASLEVELREIRRGSPAAVFRDLPDVSWAVGEDLPRSEGLVGDEVVRAEGAFDDEALEAWLEVNRRTLGWPDEKVGRRRDLYRGDDRRPRPWRHYVGRLDGAAVSASRVLL